MTFQRTKPVPTGWVGTFAICLIVALMVKQLFAILYQYRWYFPADFESAAFLIGRQEDFEGFYRFAFYAHIIAGPMTIVLACLLMASGGRSRFRKTHRVLGRVLILMTVLVIAPSGLAMATRTFAGAIAGAGFALLSVGTAMTAITAGYFARQRNFRLHQLWATRCFILLCSPLVLRLLTGGAVAMEIESPLTYRLSAWLSWLLPCVVFEIGLLVIVWRRAKSRLMSESH